MLRIGSKFPGYVHLQIRVSTVPRSQLLRFSSTNPCPPNPLPSCDKGSDKGSSAPKKKSHFLKYLGGALLAGSVGTLLYAKYDEEFRKELCVYAPFANGIIQFVFQEDESFSLKKNISLRAESLPDDADQKPKTSPPSSRELPCEPPANKSDFDDDDTGAKPVSGSSGSLRPKYSIDQLTALTQEVETATKVVVETYAEMKRLLRAHIDAVGRLIENSSDVLVPCLRPLYVEKVEAIVEKYTQLDNIVKANNLKINQVRMRIREAKIEGSRDAIELNKRKIDDCLKIASDAGRTIYEERLLKDICDQAFGKLDINRVTFLEELNALFPNLNIPERVTFLQPRELDLFLVYTAIQVDKYRDAIKSIESSRDSRITRTLCQIAPDEIDGNKYKSLVNEGVEVRKKEAAAEAKRKVAELKSECERDVAKQLARQIEIHLASLQEIQAKRAEELRDQFSDEFDRTIRAARDENTAILKEMQGELNELDELFRSRTDSDFSAHRSQGLWSAGRAITKALNQSMPLASLQQKIVNLSKEIDDIVQASVEGDEFVTTVVRTFPEESKKRGLYTQEALLERFDKVAKVALMTSIVPEEGGPLPLYLLSWIQSWFLLMSTDFHPAISKNTHFNPDKTSNHIMIKEARYWLERGDLLQALKYMNNLKGYSRRVASSWICEVQRHLEAQQAADIIVAHAVAKGML